MKFRKLSFIFAILASSSSLSAEAPTSQPSASQGYPRVACNEWDKFSGKEGKCTVETETTSWELGYYREGKEKRTFKNAVKNLIVLFHPDGFDHKFQDWWGGIVGPNKAIDTNRWIVLSLGTLGDRMPKLGSPVLLTADEVISSQTALINQLYPKAEIEAVGGPSRGGHLAILWSSKNPKRTSKLFLVAAHALRVPAEERVNEYLADISKSEAKNGPYSNWKKEAQLQWWDYASKLYVDVSYSNEYFKQPSMMKDIGAPPQEYKNAEEFKNSVIRSWSAAFQTAEEPHWYSAQVNTIQTAVNSTTDKTLDTLPRDILVISNKLDSIYTPVDTNNFISMLKKHGKQVSVSEIDDVRGHMFCCQTESNAKIEKPLKSFIEK